ncbi:MAG: LacI family transcriptional regulator [Lachnospiraceae bacterium]|nr:LacI family transcriptional regulator [Lachnospiraceae bacterium]
MTIYDISKKAGVSIATVSRVLNGSDKVSPATRQKVLDVMNECSYTPNAFARGLGLNTSKTIGIMCADSSDIYLAKAVYYLEQFLRKKGYDSILSCCGYALADKINYMNLLLSKKVDSIILVGSNFVASKDEDNTYIRETAKKHPVMILNADYAADNVYCCMCDDYQATYSATRELILSGRRDIVYVYNSTSFSGSKKLAGYMDAVKTHGLKCITEYISKQFEPSAELLEATERLKMLHRQGVKMDAVVASEDSLALGAVKFLTRIGAKCPEDVAVIGYNNSILAVSSEPELTSIDNRLELLCKQLVSNVVNVLDGNEVPSKTIFSGLLVKRQTT